MSPTLHHECIRVPVTALAAVGPLLLSAEGPFLRFYSNENSKEFIFRGKKKIFKEHAIHGVAALSRGSNDVILAIWGGPLVRFLRIRDGQQKTQARNAFSEDVELSSVIRSPDWILDLSFAPANTADSSTSHVAVCAAVTAHNALIQLTVQLSDMSPTLTELTSSSRSILYSAHLLWDSANHILVAAGTAFGEIMFWSWTKNEGQRSTSCVHQVFLGHEGSIFGVQISKEIGTGTGQKRRFLASCSDDRTIRVWDVSGISTGSEAISVGTQSDVERTRHTGFSNVELDADSSSSPCVAMGWGHLSRVWTVQFLESQTPGPTVSLLSSGEDATARTWQFTVEDGPPNASPLRLEQIGIAAYHSGKNIWSTALSGSAADCQAICGGADSKITSHALDLAARGRENDTSVVEYSIDDIVALSALNQLGNTDIIPEAKLPGRKVTEFFRSYAFIDDSSIILSTNSGKAFLETLSFKPDGSGIDAIAKSELIDQIDEVSGYSLCAADSSLGVGFVAGSRGGIYMFQKGSSSLSLPKIHSVQGKVGSMFIGQRAQGGMGLLVTLMGQQVAQLLYIDSLLEGEPVVSRAVEIPLSEHATGATVTSFAYNAGGTDDEEEYIFFGFRAGSIIARAVKQGMVFEQAQVHGKEAVTSLLWYPSPSIPTTGHLVSAGRDGCCAIHFVDFNNNTMSLVNHLPLPVGPNIEGLYDHYGHLIMYGFSSTKFILYDMTLEEEIMSVETGGSHRSWSFHPNPSREGGGTLVWTRACSMHVCSQSGSNHSVIRAGGHGREIKTIAISNGIDGDKSRKLIATGAEDTDIKIFEYVDGDFVCRRTLRKHNTGIQQLQWSEDGEYLFSSGGCEEFYVWRVRSLPSFIGIGVLCESVCAPESEHADLRLTAFDTRKKGDGSGEYVIAMVFSDSSMRVYTYNPQAATQKWHMLGKGVYFTSCLTQCHFLSPTTILTAGTDGHAVLWPLSSDTPSTKASSAATLSWKSPSRIHQNTSKTLDTHTLDHKSTLLVSGGDDGSLALFLTSADNEAIYKQPPTILVRAHTSAITACAIVTVQKRIYVLTSGNDQWIRVWEVVVQDGSDAGIVTVKRVSKLKTNVADVSSMAILGESEAMTKVVVCGVGMEVLCLGWDA